MASCILFTDFRTKRCLVALFITSLAITASTGVHINGFRIESQHPDNTSTDSMGRVYTVGGGYIMLRLFTDSPLPRTSEISFATVLAQPDSDCSDLRSTSIFPVHQMDGSTTVRVILPRDPAVYMFCVRTGPGVMWKHQGNSSWLQLEIYEPAFLPPVAPSLLPFWAHIFLIVVFLAVAAVCTALSVSVLSLSRAELKVLRASGSSDERCYAKAVSPLRKRGNRILSGIVFLGVISCAAIAVLIEDMIQLTGAAIAICSALILIFAIVIPLIICARMKLAFVTSTMCMANLVVVLSFPFSYSIGRLLDWLQSDDLPTMCERNRVQSLNRANQASIAVKEAEEELAENAGGIGTSVLGLSDKSVKDLMTMIDNVFMVEYSVILDEKCLEQIASSGYTRIPVFEKERTNIVALLHVCDLAYVSAADRTSLRTLCKFYNHPVNFVFEDTKLEVLLSEFKKGQSRMAFVQRVNDEGPGDPFYETLGMITFEDVIADIFQSEVIADPPDVIVDSNEEVRNLNRINKNNFARLPRTKKELSDQMCTAVTQFLASSVMQFSRLVLSEKVIRRLLKQDVVVNVNISDPTSRRLLYERGRPANYFILIVEGRVQIHIGSEDFIFDGGPFMYFGAQALTGEMMTKGLSSQQAAVEGFGDGTRHQVYIPDYTVEAVTNLTIVRISVEQYAGALHAALLDRHLRSIDNRTADGQRISPGGHESDISGNGAEFPTSGDALSPLVDGTMPGNGGNGECNLVMEDEKSCSV